MNKIKILGIVVLIVMTVTAFTLLNSVEVTISGKGQPHVVYETDGSIDWSCNPTTQNNCTITVKPPVN